MADDSRHEGLKLTIAVIGLLVALAALIVSIVAIVLNSTNSARLRELQVPQVVADQFAIRKLDGSGVAIEAWTGAMSPPQAPDFDGSLFAFTVLLTNVGNVAVDVTWYTITTSDGGSVVMGRTWPEAGAAGAGVSVAPPPIRFEPHTQVMLGIPLAEVAAPEYMRNYLRTRETAEMCVSFAGIGDLCGLIPFDIRQVPDGYGD